MANRDENIKKINDELEKLDDDQLDKVAGGGFFDWVKAIPKTNTIPKKLKDKIPPIS